MTKTLEITTYNEHELEQVWEMLGELSWQYGDNGGDADGNAWLPHDAIGEDEPGVREVLAAGYGRMVEVLYANNEAMLKVLGFAPIPHNDEIGDELEEQMFEAADEKLAGWARYDSDDWVYIK